MTEVDKLYSLAGIEKEIECNDPFDICSKDWECSSCPYSKVYSPPFTAEKQIRLIKWMLDKYIEVKFVHNLDKVYFIDTFNNVSYVSKNFEEAIASFICNLWQDLTSAEQNEVREILK